MSKSLSLALSLFLYFQLLAQVAPPLSLFEPVGDNVYNIAMDVDNDNELEVVCATNKRLFWVERMDDNHFSKHNVISSVALGYRSLTAADIDEDGIDDIVYASNDGGLGVHFNLGDGHFGPATEIYNPGVVIDCYVADLNDDEHLDIITATSSEVRWLEGRGNGNFFNARLVSDAHRTTVSVEATDLDDDGDLDILVAAIISDRLSWHENLGNGAFSDYRLINDVHDGPSEATTADLDGDGLLDIVCVNRQEAADTGAGLVWYHNLGGGNFELVDTLLALGWHEYVHLADMDADGDMDIVSCHGLDEISWLANDSNGNFGEAQELVRHVVYTRFVETPDLNMDGFPDLLYGTNDDSAERGNILWRASNAAGQWDEEALVTIGGENFAQPVLADIDQDGKLDIVVGSSKTEALVWCRNEGYEYAAPRLIARRNTYDPHSVAAADINGDGWPDILAGSIQDTINGRSDFCVYYNNQDGSFTASQAFRTGYSWERDLELVDVDQDGDLDMLYGSSGVGTTNPWASVGWVPNNGDSWGEFIVLVPDLTNLLDVLITDFDADGQMELVLCKTDEPQLAIMEHISNGVFTEPQEIRSTFDRGMFAQAVDVDGDGLLDLIASNDGSTNDNQRIAWWRNLGNNQFGPQQNDLECDVPLIQFYSADFDLDGRKDLVASTYFDNPMQLFRRLADGTFAPAAPIENSPLRVRKFILNDIDSDGDWDIIGASEGDFFSEMDDELFVCYNLANDESISGIVFNDLNSNGEQDTDETSIGRVPIRVEPAAVAVFTNELGQFDLYGVPGGTYTVSPELEECWSLTTTPETYEITFASETSVDSLRFGVAPNTDVPTAAVTLTAAPTRCGFTVPFWLNLRNDGCWTFDGQAYLVLSELVSFNEAHPAPNRVSGDTLFWDLAALAPGASESVALSMTIAGVEFLGSNIYMSAALQPINSQGQLLESVSFDFNAVINCAYDPNDKQVYPNRSEQAPFTQNYTLFDETLLYTLRFQNTGTDTAFHIVLRDQLSDQLDWSTFKPGSSSHPYEASLHDDGLLEFHFRNILLVDSLTNEPLSHGFVQFEIASRTDLEPGTSIENTAGIYFDFNPPIITNTVNSMMVDTLPNFTPAAAFDYSDQMLQVSFIDASTNEPNTWWWEFGDGATSNVQNPTHTYTTGGNYTVCLTASNEWGSSQYCEAIMVNVSSTAALDDLASIQFFPNPATHRVRIASEHLALPQRLTLFNAIGQPLQSILLREKHMDWDISALAAGTYWIATEAGQHWPLVVVR